MADSLIVSVSSVANGKGFRFEYGDAFTQERLKKVAESILEFIREGEELDALIAEGKITPNFADPTGLGQLMALKERK